MIPPILYPNTSSSVDTLMIFSNEMRKAVSNNIIYPLGFGVDSTEQYPVVYLLHGYGGDHGGWYTLVPELQDLATIYRVLIVCPDGNVDSWYLDSPIDSSYQYETFITKYLIPSIDRNLPTVNSPKGRAISGLSMGGHGALYLAARHPDLFGAAGSMSGGLDLRPFPDNWNISERIGSIDEFPDRWDAASVVNYDTAFANNQQALIIDCGIDDFFFEVNEQMHERLTQLGVAHDYTTRPGEHNWEYWRNAVQYQLLFFDRYFE
ncbi:MAG: alpha/beta hydrolase family protein [Bacteroidota bacterium]